MATNSSSNSSNPSTVQEIFKDYSGRRAGLIRALTQDADKLFEFCHPDKDSLCLFGYPDKSWEVTPPSESIPLRVPEPTLGINYARDGINPTDWFMMVAVHCDSWLLALAFSYGGSAGLDQTQRNLLFTLINSLPEVHEVVRDWQNAKDKRTKHKSSNEANARKSASKSSKKRSIGDGQSESTQNIEKTHVEVEEYRETYCGRCGGLYNGHAFWIVCDVCQSWYHGECVDITPTMAESINKYECLYCYIKRTIGPDCS